MPYTTSRSSRPWLVEQAHSALRLLFAMLCFSALVGAQDVQHRFLVCGQQTKIVEEDGSVSWKYPLATRDGYVLENGHKILTISKCEAYPGGAVIDVAPDGTEVVIWRGTQSEINSAQPTPQGNLVLTEAGDNPRLLEIDSEGKVLVEFALDCQKPNHHMQTRMARKLTDGTYLAPHLLDFAVIHYSAEGRVLGSLDTSAPNDPEHAIHTWPFTAIRHRDGHTLVSCTNGNQVIDFDAHGAVVWRLTNDDLPGPWLQDPCGAQVLDNGNVVITSYSGGNFDPNAPKLIEVTPEKKVVWTYSDGQQSGIHHFQILDTNGQSIAHPRK